VLSSSRVMGSRRILLETTANTNVVTQCHILEDLNPQQHCCGNLKNFTVPAYLKHFIGYEF
jgi:hypothetical protein